MNLWNSVVTHLVPLLVRILGKQRLQSFHSEARFFHSYGQVPHCEHLHSVRAPEA